MRFVAGQLALSCQKPDKTYGGDAVRAARGAVGARQVACLLWAPTR